MARVLNGRRVKEGGRKEKVKVKKVKTMQGERKGKSKGEIKKNLGFWIKKEGHKRVTKTNKKLSSSEHTV